MSVRLPTISQYKTQMAQISSQYSHAATLQVQVASGKKILQSSDDPRLAAQIQSGQDYLDRLNSYDNNLVLAQNRLALSSSVLQQATNLGIKAQTLLTQAQNASLNDSDRGAIAIELNSILESMVGLANTQDGNGEYLFNGVASGQAYVKNGTAYQYLGSYEGNNIPIGEHTLVQYNQSGYSIFGDIKSGNGQFSVAANANNTGSGILASVNCGNLKVSQDDYTISLLTNTAGQLAYQVQNNTTGQVVIPVAPADAPAYIEGSLIAFDGITTQISGSPAVGDSFTITPAQTQNIFQTLQNAINALNTPASSPQTRAAVGQVMIEQIASFNVAFNHLVDETARSGLRAQQVDMQLNFNKDMILQQKTYLSAISDVDLPETISQLSLQLTSLEMSQQSYAKLQEMFSHLLSERL